MSTAATRTQSRMTVGEFLDWSEKRADNARYELVEGVPVRLMAPTDLRHAQIQYNAGPALRRAIGEASLPYRVYNPGPGVAVGHEGEECRNPDVVVTCVSIIDEVARLVPEPTIVVEVASPSTRLADVNDKVEFYGAVASVQHYLGSSRTAAGSSIMAVGRAAVWNLGSCAKARSRWTRLASVSFSMLVIGRRNSSYPDVGEPAERLLPAFACCAPAQLLTDVHL